MEIENVIDIEVDAEQAKQGLSAYEVYLANGGTLSEEEWLESLKGITPTIGENGNWFLGDLDTGLPSKGPQGEPGSIKFIPVTELPTENIDDTAIYVKPSEKPDDKNKYEEWIYVNNDWEPFGSGGITVNLDDYVTNEQLEEVINTRGITLLNGETVILNDLDIGLYKAATTTNIQYNTSTPTQYYVLSTNDIMLVVDWAGSPENGGEYKYALVFDIRDSNNKIVKLDGFLSKKTEWYIGNTEYGVDLINYASSSGHGYKALAINNTKSYTPTGDYNPATKKYVDDATGDLTTLATTDQTSLVNAINEVASSSGIPVMTDEIITATETGIYILDKSVRAISINGSLKAITSGTEYRDISIMIVPGYKPYESMDSITKYPLLFQRDRILTWVNGVETIINYSEISTKQYVDDTTGDLTTLTTTDQSNLVNAINEIVANSGECVITILDGAEYTTKDLENGVYLLTNKPRVYYNGTLSFTCSYSPAFLIKASYTFVIDGNYIRYYLGGASYVKDVTKILTMNNTESYTPTADYNPATKKYVDDSITAAITTVLEGEY